MTKGEHAILAAWSRLGIAWNVAPARRTPNVESLILRSMAIVPTNARLPVLMASWLATYWRCIGRDRLRALFGGASRPEQARLGILLDTVDDWLPTPVFAGVTRTLHPVDRPEPLFESDRCRPALARLVELEASPISRRWGLWCLPIQPKPDAVRPVAWTLDANPSLRTRSLFKGALKTSLLAAIDSEPARRPSVTRLAAACGVTRKAVYDALDDLDFSGLRPAGTTRPRSAGTCVES